MDRRPQTVIVAVARDAGCHIARYPQARIRHHAVADVTGFDAVVEVSGLLLQAHRTPFDQRDASLGANPHLPRYAGGFDHLDVLHGVVLQPAAPKEILPAIPGMIGL